MLTTELMWQEDWLLYHKVAFDGLNKLIIINDNETSVAVKEDIYSSWKEWTMLRDNSKFLPAIRSIGGDALGSSQFAGDTYFTVNGWKILVQNTCQISGVIYSDDFPSPFITPEDTKIVTNSVSSLVQSLGFSGTIDADNELIAKSVWDYLISDIQTSGSVGDRITKLLTVAKFLGLK